MSLLWALLLDTLLSYWYVLLPCIVIGSLRNRFDRGWVVIAFSILFVSWVVSETLAPIEDKDIIFLLGALIRLILSFAILGVSVGVLSRLRTGRKPHQEPRRPFREQVPSGAKIQAAQPNRTESGKIREDSH